MNIKEVRKVTARKKMIIPAACAGGPDNGLDKPPC